MAFTYKPTKEEETAKKQQAQDEKNLRGYKTYTPGEYQQSDWLKTTWDKINSMQAPTWDKENNTWWNKLTDTMNAIENREKFSYDVNGDALYQQYKDQYMTQGKMAMMDTMGQAAAMTGGYGNSYAQSVGQQAYQGYMQQLTDKIPELYSLAMSKYQMEGDELKDRLSSYGSLYNTEYGEHRDAVTDFNNERSNLTNLYGIKSDEEYNQWYNGEQMKMTASQQEYEKLATLLGISTEQAKYLHDIAYQAQQDTYTTKYQEKRDSVADIPAFEGGNRDSAIKYLEQYATGGRDLGLRIPEASSFAREVRMSGYVSAGGKKYTNYQEYLKDYCEWAISEYGK